MFEDDTEQVADHNEGDEEGAGDNDGDGEGDRNYEGEGNDGDDDDDEDSRLRRLDRPYEGYEEEDSEGEVQFDETGEVHLIELVNEVSTSPHRPCVQQLTFL